MKIVSYESARVTILFPFEEIVPLGGVDGPTIFANLIEKYDFKIGPDPKRSKEEIDRNGLKFERGRFDFNGNLVNIQELTAYSDGLVVTANTTERAEAFAEQVLSWLRAEKGFREFLSEPRRLFLSLIVVEFDGKLDTLLPAFERISNSISKHLTPIYGLKNPVDLARIDFEFDRLTENTSQAVPRFTIERRPGVPFSRERYFSGAPMRTQHHIDVLKSIEKDMA